MACVVGLVHEDVVYIGSDSAEIDGGAITLRRSSRIFRTGPFLMGAPYAIREGDLLCCPLTPPDSLSDVDLRAYMVTEFVKAVRHCFADRGFLRHDKNTGQELGGDFLVGFGGHLFRVARDFRVVEPLDGFAALGFGSEEALGALYVTQNERNPVQRLYTSLQAAAQLTGTVRPPFHVWCVDATGVCRECQETHLSLWHAS